MEKAKRATDNEPQENIHAAVSEKDCRRMAKLNGWTLNRTRENGDPILSVDCIFEGEQTSFEDTTYD